MIRKSTIEPRTRTRLIHGPKRSSKWDYNHHVVPPITASATFRLDSVERGALGFEEFAHTPAGGLAHDPIYVYDRLDEPTRAMLEDNLAVSEGGDMALCFASGMAAISAALNALLVVGDHVVAHDVLYGCTYSLVTNWLPRHGIDVNLIDFNNEAALRAAISNKTRVLYFETPVNPDMTLIDIAKIRALADEHNKQRSERNKIRIIVDNTFATSYCQRPIECGADIVCASLTKAVGGFGTEIGGAVIGPQWFHDSLIMYRKDFGGSLAPRSAWTTLVYGLPSLATRMINYQKSAMFIAKFLQKHPRIQEVRYPGLKSFPQYELACRQMRDYRGHFAPGSMLYFVLKDEQGTGEPSRRFVNWIAENSYCITLAVSLGQIKTLIECPYWMTHSMMPEAQRKSHNLAPSGCRLSVGLEDWHDIVADLEEGLKHT